MEQRDKSYTKRYTADAMSDEELERIRRDSEERDKVEPRALTARYERKSGRLIVELRNGVIFMVPVSLLQGIAGADPELIAQVKLDARGYGLHWEALDVDLTVPGLLAGIFGTKKWMTEINKRDAVATSSSKQSPSQVSAVPKNGKKGGRPRRKNSAV